jgi:heme exporter protein C
VEWWNTLHQGATITKFDKPSISSDMLWPLLLNIFGFAFFFGALTMIRLRNEIISKESHRPWVIQLAATQSQRGK